MKSTVFLVLGILLLGGLFFAFTPDATTPSSPPEVSTPKVFEYIVKGGQVVSGPEKIQVAEGDPVTIRITVDTDEELHLHGYGKSVDLKKDEPAELSFTADIAGRFPYELEDSKIEVGALEVAPQ